MDQVSAALTAPYFFIDLALAKLGLFILDSSDVGGDDVLGGDDMLSLQSIVSVKGDFPPNPPVIVICAGLTISPKTGMLHAISGEAFAFSRGSRVEFLLTTNAGSMVSLTAVYNGGYKIFVGS